MAKTNKFSQIQTGPELSLSADYSRNNTLIILQKTFQIGIDGWSWTRTCRGVSGEVAEEVVVEKRAMSSKLLGRSERFIEDWNDVEEGN